ncbi:hypothetical protein LTR95_011911 [Oleoguttula sp. CCFEE 5521]
MGDSYRHRDDGGRDYGGRDDAYDRPRDEDHYRPYYNDLPPPPNYSPPQSPPRREAAYNSSRDGGFSFRGAADTYAPNQHRQQEEFTFRAPNERTLTTEQWGPAVVHKVQQMRQSGSGPLSRGRGGRGRGGFRGFGPRPAHTRDILVESQRETTPERLAGMDEGHVRFKSAAGFGSDDDSEVEGHSNGPQKRAKITSATNDSVPKWSNPDVYTALPCPETLGAPKKDIVQQIRKAKLDAASARASSNAVTQNDDFISFDDFEMPPTKKARSGSFHMNESPTDDEQSMGKTPSFTPSFTPTNASALPSAPTVIDDDGPPPPPAGIAIPTKSELTALSKQSTRKLPQVGTKVQPVDLTGPSPGHDSKHLTGPHNNKKRKRQDRNERVSGDIVEEWEAEPGQPSTPWCTVDHTRTVNTGLRLHKEICDFYEFVKPRDFEQDARTDLVLRIQKHLRAYGPNTRDAEVRCFGSFAAGLHLPTADMDLVAMSPLFVRTGQRDLARSNTALRKIGDYMKIIAQNGEVACVIGAKVPLVKFVDRATGVKVDLSFENNSGSNAVVTFLDWKERYPAMPVLVSVVKQMMLMRGMNEVFSGGIGGFTTICLVTNLLQTMPEIQAGAMDATQNYGEVLMKFLDYYGNRFDINSVGLLMGTPYHFRKGIDWQPFKTLPDRLTIVDPNRPENDIAGGSRKINDVLECFRSMYNVLQRQIAAIDSGKDRTASMLDCVIGGNYDQVLVQRQRLQDYSEAFGKPDAGALVPPVRQAPPARLANLEPVSRSGRNWSEQQTASRRANARHTQDSYRPPTNGYSSNGCGAPSHNNNGAPAYGQPQRQAYQQGYVHAPHLQHYPPSWPSWPLQYTSYASAPGTEPLHPHPSRPDPPPPARPFIQPTDRKHRPRPARPSYRGASSLALTVIGRRISRPAPLWINQAPPGMSMEDWDSIPPPPPDYPPPPDSSPPPPPPPGSTPPPFTRH